MHKNLLFDLDQTLLDFHASEKIALKAVMQAQGQEETVRSIILRRRCLRKKPVPTHL